MDDIRSLTEITQKVQNEAMKFWQYMVHLNSSAQAVSMFIFKSAYQQVRLYYGTENWYITLNTVHDIHLHNIILIFNYHEVSQIISTLNAHAA